MGAQIGFTKSRAAALSTIPAIVTLLTLWWLISSGNWNLFGIWTLDSTIGWNTGFGDLAFITATADCFRLGEVNLDACDPYGRPYTPYGLIPGTFLSWFGLGLQHTGVLGSLLAVIWVLLVFWLTYRVLKNWKSSKIELVAALITITLFSVSPTVMLAVERGSLDILVATFAAIGLIGFTTSNALKQAGSAVLLFISVILKYFAIGVFVPFFAPRKWSIIATLCAAATTVFMLLNLENLRTASEIAKTDALSTSRIMFSNTTGLVTLLVEDPLAFNPPESQLLNTTLISLISIALFGVIAVALTILLRSLTHSADRNFIPQESWLLIVGGTFSLTLPYFLGASNDYRLLILLLPLSGLLIWIKHIPKRNLRITLWTMVAATTITALTGAAMIPNENGFILPKFFLILGDAALATILAFGIALFVHAWLPSKKVSA